ncbi:Mitogen-activated protein kinase hog1 [Penicillium waksmanii]|uniref:Mitogen-activated protein kinase hog1 n=1 Tax=Penicillium waksmanii TaxID=69791 RepID=UPI0025493D2B|nr:Mitogen-activated protein kinase hog1 [Penicillium waksmanii]KAJ5973227.1 Mitogen-activated protein kinase hog1 [Penicillium waksmanii]
MADFNTSQVMGVTFEITSRYTEPQAVELDAAGLVCSAEDQILHNVVAVRKVTKPFCSSVLAKRALREIKLLRYLRHENIVGLNDMFISPSEDLYIVTELMWTNLQRLIDRGPMEDAFAKYFLYQTLRGLKYVHSAGIIHRDLKPCSILINDNCDLKISGFEHARLQGPQMTGYVVTRLYRAPEIMLTWQQYSAKVDVWSSACIFAEMLQGKPLFPANSHADQFSQIVKLLGSPPVWIVDMITNSNTRGFVDCLPKCQRKVFADVFPGFDKQANDLLERMLVFDVNERINARDALSHPYLTLYHDPSDEPVVRETFDWSFDHTQGSVDRWKRVVYKEVWKFRNLEDKNGLVMNMSMKPKEDTVPINIVSTSDADGNSLTHMDEFDEILSSFCENFDSGEMAAPYPTAESITGTS